MNDLAQPQSKKRQLLQWLGTAIAIALLIYLFNQQNWNQIGDAIRQISIWHLMIALGLIFCSRLAVARRWYVLLRAVDAPISWYQSLKLTFAGLFASNFLPSTIGGDVVRLAGALQYRVDGVIAGASLVVDRLVGMFGMLFALPFGYSFFLDEFTLGQLSFNSSLFLTISTKKGSSKIWRNFRTTISRIMRSFVLWTKHPASLVSALFLTGLHMLTMFGAISYLIEGTGNKLPFWMIAGLWGFVYFVTLLPISINGYGLQELSIVLALTHWGGLTTEYSIIVALLNRVLFVVASLPGAFTFPSIMARSGNK